MKAITGLFENRTEAQKAIELLKAKGLAVQNFFILSPQEAGKVSGLINTHSETSAFKGVFIGAATGGVIGLVLGLTIVPITFTEVSLMISGLVAALGGMAIGSFLGALYGSRIASNPKLQYKQQLAGREAVLLVAQTSPENEAQALQMLEEINGDYVDVHEVDTEEFNKLVRK